MADEDMALPSDRAVVNGAASVSALRASVPSAWRTDVPEFGKTPIWQHIFVQGSCYHDGGTWFRTGWGRATIRVQHSPEHFLGYKRDHIEAICREFDIDIETVRVVGWLPSRPPAPLTDETLPALPLRNDGEWSAQAIEARRAETLGSVHESAVPEGCAQPLSSIKGGDR